jgi:hypothetical protein
MNCEETQQRLPDFILASLTETQSAPVQRHLRGCAACRDEARLLDGGLALFADAAHAVEPPPQLRGRVMSALAAEWAPPAAATVTGAAHRFRSTARWLAAAAAVVAAAAVSWAGIAQHRAATAQEALSGYQRSAESYQRFLHSLGGRDVRSARLTAARGAAIQGSAVVYDSDGAQSWAGVLVRSSGVPGPLQATLISPAGRTLRLPPVRLDSRGSGWTWLVTPANLSGYRTIQLRAPSGRLIARDSLG